MDRFRGGAGAAQAAEAHPDVAAGRGGRGERGVQLRGARALPLRVPRAPARRRPAAAAAGRPAATTPKVPTLFCFLPNVIVRTQPPSQILTIKVIRFRGTKNKR